MSSSDATADALVSLHDTDALVFGERVAAAARAVLDLDGTFPPAAEQDRALEALREALAAWDGRFAERSEENRHRMRLLAILEEHGMCTTRELVLRAGELGLTLELANRLLLQLRRERLVRRDAGIARDNHWWSLTETETEAR